MLKKLIIWLRNLDQLLNWEISYSNLINKSYLCFLNFNFNFWGHYIMFKLFYFVSTDFFISFFVIEHNQQKNKRKNYKYWEITFSI